MKKIIAIIILGTAFAFSAAAQPKAVGGRFGYSGLEASYEHYVGSPNFIELELGLDYIGTFGFKTSAMYNFSLLQPNWTSRGEWDLYVGAGLSVGYVGDKYHVSVDFGDGDKIKTWGWARGVEISVPVQVGLSYTFWFPLQLAVDVRPYLGMHIATDSPEVKDIKRANFYNNGLWGFIPTLSVRYAF